MGSPDPINSQRIILFDGVCNLCNGWVKFVIQRDNKNHFKFTPLQSESGKQLLIRFGYETAKLSSIILIGKKKLYHKSDAVLEIFFILGGFWKAFYVFKILPLSLRDWMYDVVARYRYKLFGRQETCMIPTIDMRSRFLS